MFFKLMVSQYGEGGRKNGGAISIENSLISISNCNFTGNNAVVTLLLCINNF